MEMPTKEEIQELFHDVKINNLLVIVEGPNDKKALENFGIENIVILGKKPLYAVVESVARKTKKVAILTDLDKKGKELYHKLSRDLQKHGIIIDNKLREALFKAKVSHIEGLTQFMRSGTVKWFVLRLWW